MVQGGENNIKTKTVKIKRKLIRIHLILLIIKY